MRQRDRASFSRAALSLFLVSGLMATAEANGPSTFVAGDLVVRFTDASDAGQAVVRAMRATQVPADVMAVATRLSDELGVPLVAARVTSGRELVLSVDRDRLAQTLMQRVKLDPAVRGVAPVAAPKTILPAAQLVFVVELKAESEAQRQVRQAAQAGRRTTPEVGKLVARLAADLYPRPAGHVNERGELALTVDIAALTLDLVERLKRRPDVEYAQLSQVVRPFGGGTP
jgi:hypothetical protein